jgi:hypothetical protein
VFVVVVVVVVLVYFVIDSARKLLDTTSYISEYFIALGVVRRTDEVGVCARAPV